MAVMARDIQYIKEAMNEMRGELKILADHYIRRDELIAMKEDADKLHEKFAMDLEDIKIDYAKFKTQINTWGIIAGIALGIVEPIIVAFLIKTLL